MKGFYISVSNGLIEDKHRIQMGEAIWLYMLLLDKITSVTESGVGTILGGKPLNHADIQHYYPTLSRITYVRYLDRLSNAGYITTKRTPYGLIIKVLKAKKLFGADVTNMQHHSNNRSVVSKVKQPDVSKMNSDVSKMIHAEDVSKMQHVIKTRQSRQDNKTNNYVDLASQVRPIFDFYLEKFGKNPNQYKLSDARKQKIRARLKDAGPEMLRKAIENTAASPFHRGDNDRGWSANIDFIVRSYEQVERLAEMLEEDRGFTSTIATTGSRAPTKEEIDRAFYGN